jgi:acyl-[acyl-carrier-protein]-phospholipid O-acyltransferase/long-chain-fatty-acid--[acyl-carrier-protein] ligase
VKVWPLAVTKTLGNFNDNAFKAVVTFVALANETDPGRRSAIIAIGSMMFMMPYVIFPTVAGWVGDRFNKRSVLIAGKIAELVVMSLATVFFVLLATDVCSWVPLLGLITLMALQSTFFTPAFLGILPESFQERDLPKANGVIELSAFLGIILGTGSAAAMLAIATPESPAKAALLGCFFVAIALAGLWSARAIGDTNSPRSDEHFGIQLVLNYFRDYRYAWQTRPIFLCILGHAVVMSIGMLVLTSFFSFVPDDLGKANKAWVSAMQVAGAVGIGLGNIIAAKLSDHKAEFGLVPIGAGGTAFFLLGLILSINVWMALICCAGVGIFIGIFSLPMMVYLQDRTPQDVRGKTMATMNAIAFFSMFLVSLGMFMLTGGSADPIPAGGDWLDGVRGAAGTFTMRDLYKIALVGLVFTSAYAFWILPDFLCRFLVVLATRTVYKMRVHHAERVPHDGPALIIANHVSYADGFLIGAATSRFVHFLIAEEYYEKPFIKCFGKWAGLVPVPSSGGPKALRSTIETVQELLRRGEVVCIFPEGQLTGNGAIGEFKRGFLKMIPDGVDVPIVPVNLSLMWGSIFSRKYKRLKLRRPQRFPYPVIVSFGELLRPDITPSRARLAISELSSEAVADATPGEQVFPEYVIRLFRKGARYQWLKDSTGEDLPNSQVLIAAYLFAEHFRREHGEDGRYVAFILPPSSKSAILALGAMFADRAPVFLNFTASAEGIDYAIRCCGIRRIYTSRAFIEAAKLPVRDNYVYLEDITPTFSKHDKLVAGIRGLAVPSWLARRWYFPTVSRSVHETATVLFSSGSTGTPKGVVLTHHNFMTNALTVAQIIDLKADDCIFAALPFFHSFGFMATFWLPMISGVRALYHPNPVDAVAVGKIIEHEKCTILFATPTILQMYIRKCTPEQFASLRLVITGAEKLRPKVAEKFAEKFGIVPIEGYGTTELSPVVSANMPPSVHDIGKAAGKPGAVGQSIPGVSVKIVDPDTREPLEPNEDGLLLVKGPNVMREYLCEPEKTAAVLHDGWYDTGDIARLDEEGYIYITGRLSRFSKIGGEMIPHGGLEEEIHQVLGVRDSTLVVVTGVADSTKGERLVVLHLELELEASAIIVGLRERGMPNLWIPKANDFYPIDEIPLLGTGKLDLRRIRDLAESMLRS